jgi:hypothetical protein
VPLSLVARRGGRRIGTQVAGAAAAAPPAAPDRAASPIVVGTSVMAAACARWHLALTQRQRRHGCPVEAHRDPPSPRASGSPSS